MGGTFDPIHYGHLTIAQLALEHCHLTQLIFVPAGDPPHKSVHSVTAAHHRFRMTQLAVKGHPQFQLCDHEVKRSTPSYTVHLLHYFQLLYPEAALSLIMGADSLMELESWYRYQELVSMARIIVMKRTGSPDNLLEEKTRQLTNSFNAHIILAPSIHLHLSSSHLRQRVGQGLSLRYLTPDPVCRYIERHHLYGSR